MRLSHIGTENKYNKAKRTTIKLASEGFVKVLLAASGCTPGNLFPLKFNVTVIFYTKTYSKQNSDTFGSNSEEIHD